MEPAVLTLTWPDFYDLCGELVRNLYASTGYRNQAALRPICVYGIPTGGCFVAEAISRGMGITLLDSPKQGCLLVDDIVDSGSTMEKYPPPMLRAALFVRPRHSQDYIHSRATEHWIEFPWEKDHPGNKKGQGPTDAVVRLLQFIGEDPMRPGLQDTPNRFVKALREMTEGYAQEPKEILSRVFDERYDEVVIVRGIPFSSLCEHHLLPFVGTVDIGYLPNGRVVGLSKLARLVDCFSRRLQVQERMTREIAEAIREHLFPRGIAVTVRAKHSCMACRGVRKSEAVMVTSMMLGVFRDKPEARAEFLSLSGD